MNMNDDLKKYLVLSRNFALKQNDSKVRLEYLLYYIMNNDPTLKKTLKKYIKDYELFLIECYDFNKKLSNNELVQGDDIDNSIIPFDNLLLDVLTKCKNKNIGVIHILDLFETSLEMDILIIQKLKSYGITENIIKNLKVSTLPKNYVEHSYNNEKTTITKKSSNKSKTPIIDSFCRDITKLTIDNKIDPVIGRDIEIERIIQILTRRKKNNPILIGEAGVGKTAIVEGIAQRILTNTCPTVLKNKRIVSLDLTSLIAGTKYRGQFEERLEMLISELKDNPNTIVFIDEIHTIIGSGNASGGLDAANILKPALARGEIQCIGATTFNEYREYIEKDGALDRRFQKIIIKPTTVEETKVILMNLASKYEAFHKVIYPDSIINLIVNLSNRYITNREFPDKAIDVMDEVGSRINIKEKQSDIINNLTKQLDDIQDEKYELIDNNAFENVEELKAREDKILKSLKYYKDLEVKNNKDKFTIITEDMVNEVISMMTHIPMNDVKSSDITKLLNIDQELKNSIIGQDEAIDKLASSIKRNKIGIRNPNKPIGTFLFIGPTGVGKTELAKVLTDKVFGNKSEHLIKLDMSEYNEKHSISKLIGSPPGYVGYGEASQLSEKVRQQPYSVVLFDEIEKAHSDIFNILLQILDEGQLTDSVGRKIDFKNTIIIMTSNIGLNKIQDNVKIGFNVSEDNDKNNLLILEKSLKDYFKPEFLNRLDDIIYFNYLSFDNILKIVDLQINDLEMRMNNINFKLKLGKGVKEKIAELGYKKEYGVRELQRIIQKNIEDLISDEILRNKLPSKGIFKIEYDIKTENFKIKLQQ